MQLPISSMTTAEKLDAMEQLWASLQADPQEATSPDWHGAILEERRKLMESGEAKFYTLEEARARLNEQDL